MRLWPLKKNTEKPSDPVPASQMMRTMEDDLRGVPLPANTEERPPEPAVEFRPDQAGKGAPFYAASDQSDGKTAETSRLPGASPSPFLNSESESSLPGAGKEAVLPPPSPEEAPIHAAGEDQAAIPVTTSIQGGESTRTEPASLFQGIFSSKKGVGLFGLGFLGLFLLGWGVYYALDRMSTSSTSRTGDSPSIDERSEGSVGETPRQPETTNPTQGNQYFTDRPNYLSLDTETTSAESLRTLLLETAQAVKDQNLQGAVEFLVRDQNLNPLAFSRFAYLTGMGFSSEMLSQFDEAFSLFIVMDAGRPHTGLSLSLKNPELFDLVLEKNEKTLSQAISPIFVDTTTAAKNNLVFRSGSYRGLVTRYANIDPTLYLSVDYAVSGSVWYIGSSRNTLQAMLDRALAIPASP